MSEVKEELKTENILGNEVNEGENLIKSEEEISTIDENNNRNSIPNLNSIKSAKLNKNDSGFSEINGNGTLLNGKQSTAIELSPTLNSLETNPKITKNENKRRLTDVESIA